MPAVDTIRHVRLRANGIQFHVALAGPEDGPLLLCLHGFPETWHSWRHQLAALSDHYLVAAPDLRGYNETDKPDSGYDLETLAADIAGLVRALGRDRAFLAGHDWGGTVAAAAAALHKDVFPRLVLMNAPHPSAAINAFRSLDQLRRFWYVFAVQIPALPEWRLTRNGAALIPRIFMASARRRAAISPADLTHYREAILRPGAAHAALAYYRTIVSPRAILLGRNRVPAVEAPTLVLLGRDDPSIRASLFDGHDRYFRGPYEFRSIPDCGHWTQQEAPDVVNEALRAFMV
jgi:epoxide hydrolase 4